MFFRLVFRAFAVLCVTKMFFSRPGQDLTLPPDLGLGVVKNAFDQRGARRLSGKGKKIS